MYLRGSRELEAALYGLPAERGFALPMFRELVDAPPGVVACFLITGRDRVAALLHNSRREPVRASVRALHLPPADYTTSEYRTTNLQGPEARSNVRIERRLQPLSFEIPARSERLIVIEVAGTEE